MSIHHDPGADWRHSVMRLVNAEIRRTSELRAFIDIVSGGNAGLSEALRKVHHEYQMALLDAFLYFRQMPEGGPR